MSATISRLTIYALLSAIETDMRQVINNHCGNILCSNLQSEQDYIKRAKDRYESDELSISKDDLSIGDVSCYFDFSDSYIFTREYKNFFPSQVCSYIKEIIPSLEKLAPIRNRVMHIRPLDYQDFPLSIDVCSNFVKNNPGFWPNLSQTLEQIGQEPGYVLRLEIPMEQPVNRVTHNLPLPDFDETGLIGRDSIVADIKRLCKSTYPIVTIVGEGGIGKSAVALKAAYEILDDEQFSFDAVMWISSKTTQISSAEIVEIKNAIKDSQGLFLTLAESLSGCSVEPIEEVLEYMNMFNILLFIDNLETILDQNIRDFLGNLPTGSKVVITSRIGLGAFEYPVKLAGLDANSACYLARQLAKSRNIEAFSKIPSTTLKSYCERLYYNPGYIKWFIAAVGTGLRPEDVLQNSDKFLEFCMSNVYQYLSAEAKDVLGIFILVQNWKDLAELAFFMEQPALVVQKAVQDLLKTNMLVEMSKEYHGSIKTLYKLAELPKSYIFKFEKISKVRAERITKLKNQLKSIQNDYDNLSCSYRYNPNNIRIRCKSDKLVANKLFESLKLINATHFGEARAILDEVRQLSPDYFEVNRIFAYYFTKTVSYVEAKQHYELAIAQNNESPELYYWFGNFLLVNEDSIDEAFEKFKKASALDPNSFEIKMGIFRCYLYQRDFENAEMLLLELEKAKEGGMLNGKLPKIFQDLEFQFFYRRADYKIQSDEVASGIDDLYLAKIKFDSIRECDIDAHSIRKLQKMLKLVDVIERRDHEHNIIARVREIKAWCESTVDNAQNNRRDVRLV